MKIVISAIILLLTAAPVQANTSGRVPSGQPEALICKDRSSGTDPDHAGPLSSKSADLDAITEVMFSGGKQTNRNSNYGVRDYMSKSIEADADFYNSSFRFLNKLDSIDHYGFAEVPIEASTSTDVLSIAMQASHGDPYLALKTMALFGHDDMKNTLDGSSCRFQILEKVRPSLSSPLYTPGAIPGLTYSAKQIAEGQAVAKKCANVPDMLFAAQALCNDLKTRYMADYYHVIASAFLGCRRASKVNEAGALPIGLSGVAGKVIDDEYLARVKKYKLDRFREEVASLKNQGDARTDYILLRKLLTYALDQIEKNQQPLLPEAKSLTFDDLSLPFLVKIPDIVITAAAIAQRYQFEVNFRVEQHRMGMEFGKKFCKDTKIPERHCP